MFPFLPLHLVFLCKLRMTIFFQPNYYTILCVEHLLFIPPYIVFSSRLALSRTKSDCMAFSLSSHPEMCASFCVYDWRDENKKGIARKKTTPSPQKTNNKQSTTWSWSFKEQQIVNV